MAGEWEWKRKGGGKREGERINEREREEDRLFIKVTMNAELENSESLLSACNGIATVDVFEIWCTLDFYRRTGVVPAPPHLTSHQALMFWRLWKGRPCFSLFFSLTLNCSENILQNIY